MAEDQNDANTDTVEADVESAGSSPDVAELEPIIDDSGFISTTEFKPKEKPADETVDKVADPSDETEQKTEPEPSKPKPFHEHPDWQRMKRERDEARQEREALAKQIEEAGKNKGGESQEPLNIMALDDEELSEMQLNEPKKFTALVAQRLLWEIEQRDADIRKQETQKSHESRIRATLEDFFKDKEDGIEMVKDGRIKAFIDENPGHNAISAYHALSGEQVLQRKIDEAVKAERDKINRELRAAGKASTVPTTTASKTFDSPAVKPAGSKAELKQYMVQQELRRQA